jgi:uncharacterized membrane protein YeaQ/YmgE (transglycosylase-associated protein family)
LAADNLLSGVRGDVHRFFCIAAVAVAQNIQTRTAPAGVGAFASPVRRVSPLGTVAYPGDRAGPARVRSTEKSEGTMSGESLLVILLVGLIAGWLAGQIVRGTGFGLVADLCLGIIGAFIGDWLLPRLGIHLGSGILAAIIAATIGAVLLLVILRFVRR